MAFAGVVSTIGASALLFWLIQRREAGRVTPYFLLTPLVSCTIGVAFMGDRLSPQLVIGAAASFGRGASIGILSVPQAWATAGAPVVVRRGTVA